MLACRIPSRKIFGAVFTAAILAFSPGAWSAEARWVTFKTGTNAGRALEHQIDRQSIRQEGPYRTFQTRVWLVQDKQPLAMTINEAIVFWSQKYAVDCKGRRFSGDFIDSNSPREAKNIRTPATARWVPLEKFPGMEKTVCGK
jgi:hypothetical protein